MDLSGSSLRIFAAKIIISLSSFAAIVIFSREIGASPLGTYYPFIALLGIIAIPADIGIRSATEKRISEGYDERKYLGTAISLVFIPTLLIVISIFIARSYVSQYLGSDLTFALATALVIQTVGKLGIATLRGELRVGESALAMALRPIGWLVVGYILVKQGYGVNGIVWGYIIGSTAMLTVAWLKVSIRPAWPSLNHAKSLLDYGRYSFISSVGGYFYNWMDVTILSAFVALEIASTRSAIGAYENAWRVSKLVMIVASSIGISLFPQFSRWDAENTTDKIESIIPKALLPGLLVVFPAFTGTIILGEDIMSTLFGAEFTVATLALVILSSEKILQSIHIVLGQSLQAIDRPDLAAYATVVAVVINLILNVVLIWEYGITGAAIATTVSFAVNTALHAYYVNQFLDIRFPTSETLWSIIAATIMGAAVYAVNSLVTIHNILDLLVVVSFGAAVYVVVLLINRSIRNLVIKIVKSRLSTRTL